jgi:hypothetical protein
MQTIHLMLYREVIAVCSEIYTKHINTLCGLNVRFLCLIPCGTYSGHCALGSWRTKASCLLCRRTQPPFIKKQLHVPSVYCHHRSLNTIFQIKVLYNTTQHNTAQYKTTQPSTTQHNTAQHNTAQYKTTQPSTQPLHSPCATPQFYSVYCYVKL